MTDRGDRTPIDRVLSTLAEEGVDGMAEAIDVLMNEAMKLERSGFLGASLHERNSERRGHANGHKRKRVKTRVGVVDLQVPQVRNVQDGERGVGDWTEACGFRCSPWAPCTLQEVAMTHAVHPDLAGRPLDHNQRALRPGTWR